MENSSLQAALEDATKCTPVEGEQQEEEEEARLRLLDEYIYDTNAYEGGVGRASIEEHAVVTNSGTRRRDAPYPATLIGADSVIRFLEDSLVGTPSVDGTLVSTPQTLLLYGRKGSGKNTILHSRHPQFSGYRFIDIFDIVLSWKMRAWNHDDFFTWAEKTTAELTSRVLTSIRYKAPCQAMLVIIQETQLFMCLRDPKYLNALLRLLTTVRSLAAGRPEIQDAIRVVMTCSEPPPVLTQEVRALIDLECHVPLLGPEDRRNLILTWMRRFKILATRRATDRFGNLAWSIELSEKAVEDDPDHIANTLAIASQGTTPWEIYSFLKRVADACSRPAEDGSTDYNEYIINKLLFTNETGKCIVPYNPESENAAMNKFLGLDAISLSSTTTTTKTPSGFIVKDKIDPTNQPLLEEAAEAGESDPKKRKKEPVPLKQGLAEKAAERDRTLKLAAAVAEKKKNKKR